MTNQTVPVTVVIPAWNREALIARAVESALAQVPGRPAEIIVVDDCSSDATGAVAEALGARVIRHEVNQGEAGARNTGVAAASHEWVAFLDSDDEWLPTHLATVWRERAAHVLVASSARRVDPDGTAHLHGSLSRKPVVVRDPRLLLFPDNPVPASGTLARKDQVLEAGGFSDWKLGADLDMWVRLSERGTVLVRPEVGVNYYRHADQLSSDGTQMREGLVTLARSYRERPWCTDRFLAQIDQGARWDELTAALKTKNFRAIGGVVARVARSGPRGWLATLSVGSGRARRRLRSRSLLGEG